MATFNQDNQNVHGDQFQADSINVTHGSRSPIDARTIAAEFDRALSRVRGLDMPHATREYVGAELAAAQGELESGQEGAGRGRMVGLLNQGETVAGIVSNLAAAVGMFLNG
jgi:L-aminopeptidase/D-esterase-like protein